MIKRFFNHYFGGLYHRIDEHHLFLLGGGLTFSFFVCIIPFFLIVFSVLGIVFESSSIEHHINTFIDGIIPYKSYASYVKKIVLSRIEEVIAYKKLVGYLGGICLLFAASGLFSSMKTALNTIYGVRVNKNPFIEKLKDFGMVLVVLVFFLTSIIILPLLEIIKDSADKIEFLKILKFSAIQNSLILIISFLIIFTVFFTMHYFIPYEKVGKRVAAIGALWSTLLWEIAKQAFGYYITNVASLKNIYGTYVLIVIVAFWIYYSSIVFLLGAEIGQLYRERVSMVKVS